LEDVCSPKSCNEKFKHIEIDIKNMRQDLKELNKQSEESIKNNLERLIITEQSSKSAHNRMDEFNLLAQSILKMSVSVDHFASEMSNAIEEIKKHNVRISDIETKMPVNDYITNQNNDWIRKMTFPKILGVTLSIFAFLEIVRRMM